MNTHRAGQVLPGPTISMTSEQVFRYADASGDHNPIHLDDETAKRAGLPGRIAHGMLTMGVFGTAASTWAGNAERIISLRCRFRRPVLVGDVLTVRGTVLSVDADLVTVAAEVVNQREEMVLGNASVVFTTKAANEGEGA